MDLEKKHKELLKICSDEEKNYLTLYKKSAIDAAKLLLNDPSKVLVEQRARRKYEEYVKQLWEKYFIENEEFFKSGYEVAEFLHKEGYKIGKSKVYKDIKEGLLRRRNGKYYKSDVLKYAQFLPRLDSGSDDELGRRKLELDIELMEIRKRRELFEEELKRGEYIRKEEHEHAIASRAAMFKNDLFALASNIAPKIVEIVDGDDKKIPLALKLLQNEFRLLLERYVRG